MVVIVLCVNLTHSPTSKYIGVSFNKKSKKWRAVIYFQKQAKDGGDYGNELDAAKKVNQMCDELKIKRKNPEVDAMPTPKIIKLPSSQYKGVSWDKSHAKWQAYVSLNNKMHCRTCFENEIDAAKTVNQLCDEFGIQRKNPGIGTLMTKKKVHFPTSKYNGVSWNKTTKKWVATLQHNNKKYCYGSFDNEEDAAIKVNLICDKCEIKHKNPTIKMKLDKYYDAVFDYNEIKTECENLIKHLDKSTDAVELTMKEFLIDNICCEKTMTGKIRLNTKDSELTLSIAAQHGFSNVVNFLIFKGVKKEHFTNEHCTPLSLAVAGNHVKTVEALLDDWISPNTYEEGYIHLAPIFNVRSREMAQLLIENDAITDGLYNENYQSPLTVACQNGYLDVVEFFLDDGLDINHVDYNNKTPLDYTLLNKHENVTKLLIEKGARTAQEISISNCKRKREKTQEDQKNNVLR